MHEDSSTDTNSKATGAGDSGTGWLLKTDNTTEPMKEDEPPEATAPNMDVPNEKISIMTEDGIPNLEIPHAEMSTVLENSTPDRDMTSTEVSIITEDATPNMDMSSAEVLTMKDDVTSNMDMSCANVSTTKEVATPNMVTSCAELLIVNEDATPDMTSAEMLTMEEYTSLNMDMSCADMLTMKEETTPNMDMSSAELLTMNEDATPNMDMSSAEVTIMKEEATPNMDMSSAELLTVKEETTPNMDMSSAEMWTIKEDATPNMDMSSAEVSVMKEDPSTSTTAYTLGSTFWKKPHWVLNEMNNTDKATLNPLTTEQTKSAPSAPDTKQTPCTIDQQVPRKKRPRISKRKMKRLLNGLSTRYRNQSTFDTGGSFEPSASSAPDTKQTPCTSDQHVSRKERRRNAKRKKKQLQIGSSTRYQNQSTFDTGGSFEPLNWNLYQNCPFGETSTVHRDQSTFDTGTSLEPSDWIQYQNGTTEHKTGIEKTQSTDQMTSVWSPASGQDTSNHTPNTITQQKPLKTHKTKKKRKQIAETSETQQKPLKRNKGKKKSKICTETSENSIHVTQQKPPKTCKRKKKRKQIAQTSEDSIHVTQQKSPKTNKGKKKSKKITETSEDVINVIQDKSVKENAIEKTHSMGQTTSVWPPVLERDTSNHTPDSITQQKPLKTYKRKKKRKQITETPEDTINVTQDKCVKESATPTMNPHCGNRERESCALSQPAEGLAPGTKEKFECLCGGVSGSCDQRSQVQCEKCGLWQHAACVQYDLADPYRGPYLCPHCHVAAVSPLFYTWLFCYTLVIYILII